MSSESWVPSDPKIQMVKIRPLDFVGYSRFILANLADHVATPYCLVIQADGFVLNANKWNPSFLEYDYIGAPWPLNLKLQPGDIPLDLSVNSVGNGGFSLRSKKLLLETQKINHSDLVFPTISEDLIICHFLLEKMSEAGIRFPTPELAAQFSVESHDAAYGQSPKTSFGFHGKKTRDEIFNSLQQM